MEFHRQIVEGFGTLMADVREQTAERFERLRLPHDGSARAIRRRATSEPRRSSGTSVPWKLSALGSQLSAVSFQLSAFSSLLAES
jgi:hypothetical protein